MVIPESNKYSFGFVDLRNSAGVPYPGAGIIANNVSFIGATLAGSFFRSRGNYQSFILTDVDVDCTNGDGLQYSSWKNGENYSIVNCDGNSNCTVTIKGGTYKYASRANNAGIFQDGNNAISSYEDVTVISEHGPINQGLSYSCTIKNCNFSNPNNVSANSWTNTAICAASNQTINVNGGYYEGNYALYVYNSAGTINVAGGTFVGNTNVIKLDNIHSDRISTVNISGGNFTGSFSLQSHCILSITGGTFDHDPSAYVADGHVAVYDPTTHKYTVEAAQYWEDEAVSDDAFAAITDEENKIISISTAAQLAKLAKNVNAHVPLTTGFIYKGYTVKLENDIDLAGKIWTPIGVCEDWTRGHFTGTFDGQGHTISNLKVVREDRAGLFGSIYGEAVIKNLNVTNVTLIANHFAAGIVGWINEENYDLVVDNCSVTGGVITVVPNFVNNEWDNGDKCGGVVGYSNQNTANHCKITNNRAENLTITAYRDCGGIVGFCSGNVLVSGNTANNVTLVQDNFRGYKSSVTTVQQIVGRNDGSTQENNTATGVVINTVN